MYTRSTYTSILWHTIITAVTASNLHECRLMVSRLLHACTYPLTTLQQHCSSDTLQTWLTVDGLAAAVPVQQLQPAHGGTGHVQRVELLHSVSEVYNRSLYLAVAVVITTGLGDIVAHTYHETLAIMAVFVLSVTLTLAAVGNLTLLITANDPTGGEHVVRVEAAHRVSATTYSFRTLYTLQF
jgi:hypothetical protein